MKPNSGGDETVAYAGPSQHVKIREHVTKAVGETVTPDVVLKLTGIKSHKAPARDRHVVGDKSEMTPGRL